MFRSLDFSETLQKHEQSRYTNYFDIRDPVKIHVFEPQGGKWGKMAQNGQKLNFLTHNFFLVIRFLWNFPKTWTKSIYKWFWYPWPWENSCLWTSGGQKGSKWSKIAKNETFCPIDFFLLIRFFWNFPKPWAKSLYIFLLSS